MSDEVAEETYTTIAGTGEEEFDASLAKMVESRVTAKAKRTQTYRASELPVRPCTTTCPLRATCKDYLSGKVNDSDLCRPQLKRIKKLQVAYRKGDLDSIKDEAGAVAGALLVQFFNLQAAVSRDGPIIDVEKYSASGDRYTEQVAHPGLREMENIAKVLNLGAADFHMTPKSQKDDGPKVQVNVGISMAELNARWQERYAGKVVNDS